MCALKIAFFVMTISYVAAQEATKIKPCHIKDIPCVITLTQQAALGYPEHNITSADSVIIPELEIDNSNFLVFLYNIHVTGMGNLKVDQFLVGKSNTLAITAPLQIESDIIIKSKETSKAYLGTYKAKAYASAVLRFAVEFKMGVDGSKHSIIKQQMIVGKANGKPKASLEFYEDLYQDEEFMTVENKWLKHQKPTNKVIIKKIVEGAFVYLMDNMRSISTLLPLGAFFSDMS